jgi:hypothetical protein
MRLNDGRRTLSIYKMMVVGHRLQNGMLGETPMLNTALRKRPMYSGYALTHKLGTSNSETSREWQP